MLLPKAIKKNHFFLIFSCLFLFNTFVVYSQKSKVIELKGANSLESDDHLGKGAKRLIGNVVMKHENILMYCDSAYMYSDNSMDAFGNVHVRQGDSLNIYGDLLKYSGNTKIADIQRNVRLVDHDMTLTTNSLNYDLSTSTGYYTSQGKIISKEITLVSKKGYFNSSRKEFLFKTDVVLTNPQYVMNCDTLKYNTSSKVAYFLGPTTIKSKENFIYCQDGWYNTNSDNSKFSKNAYIITKEQILKGDTIYYDRKKGLGKAINNISIIDTIQNINIKGNYAEHYEKTNASLVHGKAVLIQIFDHDTLFLHADTLKAGFEKINLNAKFKPQDTLKENRRIVYAFHKVKFFKSDMQGMCDSLVYTSRDSSMQLLTGPVLWSDKNQLTAKKITIKISNGEIKSLQLIDQAFIISQEDSLRYNQIKGKKMEGYFVKSKLQNIHVQGNGQTIYYVKDDKKVIGINKADCSNLLIVLKDNQVSKITFITKPQATMFPLYELDPKELLLKNFIWKVTEKPLSKNDIFK